MNTNDFLLSSENNEKEEISAADIRSELFEGDNIVVGKSDYGQSQLVSGPFALNNKLEQNE
jgi:hypothetical protein